MVLEVIRQNGINSITEEELEEMMKKKRKEENKRIADEQFKAIINEALEEDEREILKELLRKIIEAQDKIFPNKEELKKKLEKVEFALSLDLPEQLKSELYKQAEELKKKIEEIEKNPKKSKKSPTLNWWLNVLEQVLIRL